MMTDWKKNFVLVLALGILAGIVLTHSFSAPALAVGEKGGAASNPAYSVIHTEGHNLIVTDNKSNILYFYTIDKDAAIGSDLKMRGQLDLNHVGKAVLRPTKGKVD